MEEQPDFIIRRTRVSAKIAPKFAGPYAIIAKTFINTDRIRALDANDEELIHAEHLKPYVGATPFDDEQEEEPQPPRESVAILAMSDPPVASNSVAIGSDPSKRGGRFTYPFSSTRAQTLSPEKSSRASYKASGDAGDSSEFTKDSRGEITRTT